MSDTMVVHSRERLAWAFLLAGFIFFVSAAIAVPITVSATIQKATQPLTTSLQANQGTVRIDRENGDRAAVLAGEPAQAVEAGASIQTDTTATALVLVSPPNADPNSEQLLARLQVYSNTHLDLMEASAPRFRLSTAAQRLAFNLENGRLQLRLPAFKERPLAVSITTPQGRVIITDPGQYSLEVDNETTQVTVQEGIATVSSAGQTLTLRPEERAEIPLETGPIGPLAPERNLIQNGDFSDRWQQWIRLAWDVELPNQPEESTEIIPIAGDTAFHVVRKGEGHADTGLRQPINQDVTDFNSLLLEVDFRIVSQTLGVCGQVGSECPLIIQIEYDDINGNSQVWQQGFYAAGEIDANETPDICTTCPEPRFEHYRVILGQFSFYRADLIEDLQRKGFLPPSRIKSVTLTTSGHGFEVDILNVALIAEELARGE